MFAYQKQHRFFALVGNELHDLAIAELQSFGCTQIQSAFRGLHFTAEMAALYRANYCSRFISKIIAPLATFRCVRKEEFYRNAQRIDWEEILALDTTFAIFANVTGSRITHSQYASLVLKDAIVDQFRKKCEKRPSVDTLNPDIWLSLYIERDFATIGIDTSGGPLHKRGYRNSPVEAPMQETLAAAIIARTGWNGERKLYDPMCGSGTLLAEAAMHCCGIPAGFFREKFGFQRLPDFDEELWKRVKGEAGSRRSELPEGLIGGSDISKEAVWAARKNLCALPGGKRVRVFAADFRDLPPIEGSVIVCNPPYGVRLKGVDVPRLYSQFGDFLKRKCTGSAAYVYTGVKELTKAIGLKPAWRTPMVNGNLKGELVKIEVY